MALTRVTSSVLDSNAISAEKIANSALTNRMYGVKSIGLENLQNDANFLVYIGNFNANTNLVENNVRQTSANAAVERANVLTITSNIVQNVANINLNTGTGVRLSQNLAANVNQTTANVTAVEARRVANIAGAVSTITTGNLTASRALVSDGSGKVAVSDVTSTELGYVDGVTSAIQTQLDAGVTNAAAVVTEALGIEARRVANIAGAVSSITTSDLTASRALVSDGSGKVAVLSSVTSTELGYVDATSSIQTQLSAGVTNTNSVKANVDAAEANIAGVLAGTKNFTGGVTMGDDLVIQGNLTVLGDSVTANTINAVIQDRFLLLANSATGAPSADIGIFMNRGNEGNAALFYDESAKSFTMAETRDPDSNVVISPTGLANLAVGTLKYNGADLNTAITDNRSGAISTVYKDNLTVSRALASDGSGKIIVSDVTSTELGYLDGVTSAIQTQIGTTNTNLADNSTRIAAVETRRVANIAGAVSSITTSDLTASRALVSDGSGKVAVLASVTSTELGYVDATSSIQTQLDAGVTNAAAVVTEAVGIEARRVANIAGAVSTITTSDLTASRALVSDGSGKVAVLSSVTSTELGYVDATSSIQTQLSAGVTNTNSVKANVDAAEANIAGVLAGTKNFTGGVTMGDDLVIQGNLTVLGDSVTANTINAVIQDRFLLLANSATGAPSADIGIFMNRGNEGNAALFYDESAKSFTMAETRDPDSNVVISPTGLANLAVGTLKYNGADLNTAITDNRSGAISTVYKDNLTVSRALASDGSGKIIVSDVTSTELGYLDGVTSAIQTQIGTTNTNLADNSTRIAAVETRRVANIAGAVSSITTSDLTASRALVSDGSGKVAVLASVTSTELGYVDATSSIQTQLDAGVTNAAAVVTEAVGIEARRVANIAGAVSTITTSDLTASRAVVSSGAGKVSVSDVTSTELGYLDGVTSAIQTQLDSKGSSAGYEANDFVTYTRLNANINVVSSNVAVGQIMKVNVIASTDGEGAGNNNFFIATPPAGNPAVIDNIAVTIDGVTQAKTTDYLYTAGTGKITFKDAAIPTGLTVTITSLNPPA